MRKAALYARVSTGHQEKERTIESQIAELKKQIAKNCDVLVNEYIDDGHSGAKLDRPAMNRLRDDLTSAAFDSVYFLSTDRIARDVAYQTVIIGEVLKNGKKLIVGGRDFEKSPENDFTLTVLGAASQLERAKIIERNYRGKMHQLRNGQVHSNGHNTFGYDYVKKGADSPARVVVNKREARTVRYIFKAYADGASWSKIVRRLENSGAMTKTGGKVWHIESVRTMLQNTSYTGTKYFNTRFHSKKSDDPLRKVRYGRKIYRDKSEWIAIKVPAIVTQKLFDMVQARLEASRAAYRGPKATRLFSGLLGCGDCGKFFMSYSRTWKDKRRKKDPNRIFHKTAYRCSRIAHQRVHARHVGIRRCANPEVQAHLLESCVWEMAREIMTNPEKFMTCLDISKQHVKRSNIEADLKNLETKMGHASELRKRAVDRYAGGEISRMEYAKMCGRIDANLEGIKSSREKMWLALPALYRPKVIEIALRKFCTSVRDGLDACVDDASRREFITKHVEKIVYLYGRVQIKGAISVGDAEIVPFAIESAVRKSRAAQ